MPKLSKQDRNFWRLKDMRAMQIKCEAQTRAGPPCRAPAMANGRCRMHGGLATGPKTKKGRAVVARAQRARWARYRTTQNS